MTKCLRNLLHTLRLQWRSVLSFAMIAYLMIVANNWGELDVWVWVAMICGLYLTSGECKYKTDAVNVLALWWCGNVTLTMALNAVAERPVEESGGTVSIFGIEAPTLTIDYLVMAPYDFIALAFVGFLTYKNIQRLTVWYIIISCYLLGNLYIHFSSCYALFAGISPTTVAASYDAYTYGLYYVCLTLLLIGSVADRLMKYGGFNIDLDCDLRSAFSRIAHRSKWG